VVIVPSIDVRSGHIAYRGVQIRFTPSELAERYVEDGAEELHLVDRDSAERGDPANLALLAAIARRSRVPARLAGGISSVKFAREAIDAGFSGVLFSSAVLGDDDLLRDVAALGRAAIVEIEAKEGFIAPRGGDPALVEAATGRGVLAAARAAVVAGVTDLYIVDLGSEGALAGPATGLLEQIRGSLGDLARRVRFHTGGGIASPDDVRALARWGAASAVIGRAFLEGRLTLAEAMAAAR
jgi:phosphoribosylformimino-5-aminoimidazole carboxamide ribotide isomerase